MHESNCCFANLNQLLFRRSPCRHCRRCLSSLLVEVKEQKNAEAPGGGETDHTRHTQK